jgi:hypothetical protein
MSSNNPINNTITRAVPYHERASHACALREDEDRMCSLHTLYGNDATYQLTCSRYRYSLIQADRDA